MDLNLTTTTEKNITPRQYRIGVSVFFFISGFNFASFVSRIPFLQKQLHINEAALGSLLFALPLGLITSIPFTGIVIGKFSSRYSMFVGSIFYSIVLCFIGSTNQVWLMAIYLFLFGASRSLFNVSVNTQGVDVQAMYKKSIITSFHGVWSLACFAGAGFTSLMIALDVDTLYHFIIVLITTIPLAAYFYRYTVHHAPKTEKKRQAFALPDKALFKLGLVAFGSMICEGTMSEWTGVYFSKVVHAPEQFLLAGYIAYTSAMTTGRFIGDWIINKAGHKMILQLSGILIACGILLVVIFPYTIPAAIGCLLTGFGVSCIMPLVFVSTSKVSTLPTGPAIASVSTIGYAGFLFGPPVIGFIAQTLNLQWSFALVALIGIAVTILVSYSPIKN